MRSWWARLVCSLQWIWLKYVYEVMLKIPRHVHGFLSETWDHCSQRTKKQQTHGAMFNVAVTLLLVWINTCERRWWFQWREAWATVSRSPLALKEGVACDLGFPGKPKVNTGWWAQQEKVNLATPSPQSLESLMVFQIIPCTKCCHIPVAFRRSMYACIHLLIHSCSPMFLEHFKKY